MSNKLPIGVHSEIGELEGVIIHTPGSEVENMTPETAERALYSDILSLEVVNREYHYFKEVLKKVTKVYSISDLLTTILEQDQVKKELIEQVFQLESQISGHHFTTGLKEHLLSQNAQELTNSLIAGVALEKNTLTRFMSDERFALRPLHNFFFTRDASVSIYDEVLICKMANAVRDRESLIMKTIFEQHPKLQTKVNDASTFEHTTRLNIEGGDVLVAREDILIVGNGVRTSTAGIDYLTQLLKNKADGKKRHIVVQELPRSPESFIHLDMVFTLLDRNKCMVYEPLIAQPTRFRTVLITIEGGKVKSITEKHNLLTTLSEIGMDLEPVVCGGSESIWQQEREQWHSGANFFAFAPGKVIGYARNTHTAEALNKQGFEILSAEEVVSGAKNVADYTSCLVTLKGSELPRGGGGARCMTMPVRRKAVDW